MRAVFLGGISTGQISVLRFSRSNRFYVEHPDTRKTINHPARHRGSCTKVATDPCVGIRAVPRGRAMMACVLLDKLAAIAVRSAKIRAVIG